MYFSLQDILKAFGQKKNSDQCAAITFRVQLNYSEVIVLLDIGTHDEVY